jgi:thermolabile hemolysin
MEIVAQNLESKYCQKSGILNSSAIPPGQGGFPAAPIMTLVRHFLRHARLALGLWVLASTQGLAGFSSVYVFGDGVCNTNVAPTGPPSYWDNRYCNGKVWVEVLSGWHGVTLPGANNISYFGHDSSELKTSVQSFPTPPDAATSLFIVWSNDADYVDAIGADIDYPFGDLAPWTQLASTSIANHLIALDTLYTKGAREIVLPLAVDVMSIPFYNEVGQTDRAFARNRIIEYNTQFNAAMLAFMSSKPGLKIHLPDTFSFFEQVLANPAAFGMVNPVPDNAGGLDAPSPSLNGNGANYVFWDLYHPTAKFQMHLAAFIQQIISPVKVNSITLNGGNVQLDLANAPLGRAGVVLGSSNLQSPWTQEAVIGATNPVVFPAKGSKRFYRAAFPVVWTWP